MVKLSNKNIRLNARLLQMEPTSKKRQKGLATVEYAVAGALIAAGLVAAFSSLGNEVENVINALTNNVGG